MPLEPGGKAPFIKFDTSVEGAMQSKFRGGGQICVCADCGLVCTGDTFKAFAIDLRFRSRICNPPDLAANEISRPEALSSRQIIPIPLR